MDNGTLHSQFFDSGVGGSNEDAVIEINTDNNLPHQVPVNL